MSPAAHEPVPERPVPSMPVAAPTLFAITAFVTFAAPWSVREPLLPFPRQLRDEFEEELDSEG